MNNEERTPFVDSNLRRAYLEGLKSREWETNTYMSPPMRAAWDSGRNERARLRAIEEQLQEQQRRAADADR